MSPYPCPNCRRLFHFETRVCPHCLFTVGYDPVGDGFVFLGDNLTVWRDGMGRACDLVVCANNDDHAVCNWMVAPHDPVGFCLSCRHNRTIPDLTGPEVYERWGKIEAAKRRLIHTLLRLGLPLESRRDRLDGLAFDFLYDPLAEQTGTPHVMTGHNHGVVTLNLIEADDVQRERIRREMREPYRTLLGHFRHEVGHYYWERLIAGTDEIEHFRVAFGDERIDYGEALQAHYNRQGYHAWSEDYVSAYAAAHPWEDFAETFAHVLHMIDGLATLHGLGATLAPFPNEDKADGQPKVDFDPYHADTRRLVTQWVRFSFALNAVNRSMAQPDLYPFRISAAVTAKLDYVNRLLHRRRDPD